MTLLIELEELASNVYIYIYIYICIYLHTYINTYEHAFVYHIYV
jgi:hypothetical protein